MVFIDKRGATGPVDEWGHEQADTIFGSSFGDTLRGAQGDDSILGGGGADFIADVTFTLNAFGVIAAPLAFTVAHSLRVEGIDVDEDPSTDGAIIYSYYQNGNDTFRGEAGNDTLMGFFGDDSLDGGTGSDDLSGGRGDDVLLGGSEDDFLLGGSGNDDLSGGTEQDTLAGGSGNDTLDGGAGDDVMNGGTGADSFFGGSGADAMDGGDLPSNYYDALVQLGSMTRAAADALIAQANAGDTASFNLLRAVDVDLERAVQVGGDAEGDTLTGIENLKGTLRADVLRGDDKANVLEGNAGSDVIEGRGGADRIDGGNGGLGSDPGIDAASYESSAAAVNVDLIRATQIGGDAQGDVLLNIEKLIGSAFADRLSGDDLDNIFDGGFGNDTIDGRGGTDTIDLQGWDVAPFSVSARSVSVTLADVGDGSAVRSDFFRVAETDTLRGIENVLGTNVKDTITGNSADNLIEGRGGNDVINGGAGNDTINGGAGFDTMTGGAGNDTFLFTAASDAVAFSGSALTGDLIRGFDDNASAHDIIDLSAIDANALAPGNQRFFLDNHNGVTEIGELFLSSFADPAQAGATVSTVFADVTGNGNADFLIRFDRLVTTLDATDFIL